jgi:hypothetical protein
MLETSALYAISSIPRRLLKKQSNRLHPREIWVPRVLHYFDDVSEAIPSADNEEKYYDSSDARIGMKQTTSDKQLCVRHANRWKDLASHPY